MAFDYDLNKTIFMQRILFSFLLFSTLSFFDVNAQNFYQRDTIQVIEIFFSFSNWDAQLDANEATETYIYADSVRINGVSSDSCGVRYKGNSSYNPSNQKNPLRIELNTIKNKCFWCYTSNICKFYPDISSCYYANCWYRKSIFFAKEKLIFFVVLCHIIYNMAMNIYRCKILSTIRSRIFIR